MHRFLELKYNNKVITNSKQIEEFLYHSPFTWLLECEVDDVKLEIDNNILYWKSGIFYWGHWQWGVFDGGEFRSGTWYGGILRNGVFYGIFKNGVIKGGEFTGKNLMNTNE